MANPKNYKTRSELVLTLGLLHDSFQHFMAIVALDEDSVCTAKLDALRGLVALRVVLLHVAWSCCTSRWDAIQGLVQEVLGLGCVEHILELLGRCVWHDCLLVDVNTAMVATDINGGGALGLVIESVGAAAWRAATVGAMAWRAAASDPLDLMFFVGEAEAAAVWLRFFGEESVFACA